MTADSRPAANLVGRAAAFSSHSAGRKGPQVLLESSKPAPSGGGQDAAGAGSGAWTTGAGFFAGALRFGAAFFKVLLADFFAALTVFFFLRAGAAFFLVDFFFAFDLFAMFVLPLGAANDKIGPVPFQRPRFTPQ
jgi:hypothetical protein